MVNLQKWRKQNPDAVTVLLIAGVIGGAIYLGRKYRSTKAAATSQVSPEVGKPTGSDGRFSWRIFYTPETAVPWTWEVRDDENKAQMRSGDADSETKAVQGASTDLQLMKSVVDKQMDGIEGAYRWEIRLGQTRWRWEITKGNSLISHGFEDSYDAAKLAIQSVIANEGG